MQDQDLLCNQTIKTNKNKITPFVIQPHHQQPQSTQIQQNQQRKSNIFNQNITFLYRCLQQQKHYRVTLHQLRDRHPQITFKSRAILIDWMAQLCEQHRLFRTTFHIAVNIVDRFLANTHKITLSLLQPIGATALFIASKLEERQSRPSQWFAKATAYACTAKKIKALQNDILKKLQYKLNPPTVNIVADIMTTVWDQLTHENFKSQLQTDRQYEIIYKGDRQFDLYRMLVQMLDTMLLDGQSLNHSSHRLVASTMYLLGAIYSGTFPLEMVSKLQNNVQIMQLKGKYNDLFSNFLAKTLDISLQTLFPSTVYVSKFFQKEIMNRYNTNNTLSFQIFNTHQTYINHSLQFILSKMR